MLTSCFCYVFFTNDELWESGAVVLTNSLGAFFWSDAMFPLASSCHLIMPGQTTGQVGPRRASSSARLALDQENSWEMLTMGRSCMETQPNAHRRKNERVDAI